MKVCTESIHLTHSWLRGNHICFHSVFLKNRYQLIYAHFLFSPLSTFQFIQFGMLPKQNYDTSQLYTHICHFCSINFVISKRMFLNTYLKVFMYVFIFLDKSGFNDHFILSYYFKKKLNFTYSLLYIDHSTPLRKFFAGTFHVKSLLRFLIKESTF